MLFDSSPQELLLEYLVAPSYLLLLLLYDEQSREGEARRFVPVLLLVTVVVAEEVKAVEEILSILAMTEVLALESNELLWL